MTDVSNVADEDNRLRNLLLNVASMMDAWKAGEPSTWTTWDQEQRDYITTLLRGRFDETKLTNAHITPSSGCVWFDLERPCKEPECEVCSSTRAQPAPADVVEPWRTISRRAIRESDGAWGHLDDDGVFHPLSAMGVSDEVGRLRWALQRIAQPVFVAEPVGTPDGAWFTALNERMEIARHTLSGGGS